VAGPAGGGEQDTLKRLPGRFGGGFNQKYRYYSGIYFMCEDGPDETE
jgi:hypothetical protein